MRLGIGSYTCGWTSGTYGWTLTKGMEHLTAGELVDGAVDLVQIYASVVLEQWTPFADSIEQTIADQEQWARQGIAYLKKDMEENPFWERE